MVSSNKKLREKIVAQIEITDIVRLEELRQEAENILFQHIGRHVSLRGLIEFSNICHCDCLYCGIRKSNRSVTRFELEQEEIVQLACQCAEQGYGSLVLQSGERNSPAFVDRLLETLAEIKRVTRSENLPDGLGITLSVGEHSLRDYERFFIAGAHRYLLRIETSSPVLFKTLHPHSQSWEKRVACLAMLKNIGYQVGTGVMIGLPGQTIEMLADDILFFQEKGMDMIGMGPYIPHVASPLHPAEISDSHTRALLGLKMIAATRLLLPDVNIASTTALQTLLIDGRIRGLQFGANVVMQQLTPDRFCRFYTLYDGKPVRDADNIFNQIALADREISQHKWGDSLHFLRKQKGSHHAVHCGVSR